MGEKEEILFEGKKLGKLLEEERLNIPNYQRPYTWRTKHIRNLFYDIKEARQGKSYHIGTLILHKNHETTDIVDGQQRLISIALFLNAMKSDDKDIVEYAGAQHLLEQEYSEQSCQHAKENFEEWKRLIESEGKEEAQKILKFLLENCEVSVITMPEDRLSEAFQLFDSQNNRGKSLEPHDLLKAYHLRRISSPKEKDIESWEKAVFDEQLPLKELFNQYLFRMRRWSNGESGLTKNKKSYLRFTEAYIDDFKGIDLSQDYPYLKLYKILDDKKIEFPKSLLMPIINGKTFFDYIAYAHKKIKYCQVQKRQKDDKDSSNSLDFESYDLDERMISILKSKKSRYSRNRNLFENLLVLYIDRFGENSVDKTILKLIFVWAYYPRIKMSAIYDATQANYAVGKKISNRSNFQNVFQLLQHSATPEAFKMNFDHEIFENISIQDIYEKEESKK